MATLTYLDESYEVDHVTKGADFIHAFDKNGYPVVFFDGITDFSKFTYSAAYMSPEHCAGESCNTVRYYGGKLQTADGRPIAKTVETTLVATSWREGSYRLNLSEITATSNQDILPGVGISTAQLEALQGANLVDDGQGAGYTDLIAHGDVPTIDIPIRVLLRGDA